jgi:hypothetical protein
MFPRQTRDEMRHDIVLVLGDGFVQVDGIEDCLDEERHVPGTVLEVQEQNLVDVGALRRVIVPPYLKK